MSETDKTTSNSVTDAERQRLEEGGQVVTKTFIAALRERFSDEKAARLRKFIDATAWKKACFPAMIRS